MVNTGESPDNVEEGTGVCGMVAEDANKGKDTLAHNNMVEKLSRPILPCLER